MHVYYSSDLDYFGSTANTKRGKREEALELLGLAAV